MAWQTEGNLIGETLAITEQRHDAGVLPRQILDTPELIGPNDEVLEWAHPWAARFLEVFAQCAALSTACKAAAVHVNAVQAYRHASRRFNRAMLDSVDSAVDAAQNSMLQRGLRGDTTALKYWLDNVGRHRFGRTADQNAHAGGQIEIVIKWPEGIEE